MVGLYKTGLRTDVRPLGLRNSLVKLYHREVINQTQFELRQYLEPVQLGMSTAGAIRARNDHVCFRINLSNSFIESSKAAILEVLENKPALSHLTGFTGTALAPTVELESGGQRWGVAEEGVVQGDPEWWVFLCGDATIPDKA